MEAHGAADLLDVWERGASLGPHERALVLLGRARPDLPGADLGVVPIGRRDAELLRLRRAMFGGRMSALVSCPSCGEPLELDIDVGAITPPEPPALPGGLVRLTVEGRAVAVRIPGTEDLAAALAAAPSGRPDAASVRRALLARLVEDTEIASGEADGTGSSDVAADDAGRPDVGGDRGAALEAAIGEAILAADPGAEIRLAVDCVACERSWETTLDIASYLWAEIADAARRLASDVAALAATYGWREADVLAMSPWRRRLYLDLAAE